MDDTRDLDGLARIIDELKVFVVEHRDAIKRNERAEFYINRAIILLNAGFDEYEFGPY